MSNENLFNYIVCAPSVADRLLGRTSFLVCDFLIPSSDNHFSYFLDRFLAEKEIPIWYDINEFSDGDSSNIRLHFIKFRKKDKEKVKEALEKMLQMAPMMEGWEEYEKALEDFQDIAKEIGFIRKKVVCTNEAHSPI